VRRDSPDTQVAICTSLPIFAIKLEFLIRTGYSIGDGVQLGVVKLSECKRRISDK